MIVLVDNYDSFSYNLYQAIGAIEPEVEVVRNDAIDVAGILALDPEALVLSPGPGRPADAGVCEQAVRELTGRVPILGVCLSHQAICEALGGTIRHAPRLMHGKDSLISYDPTSPLFKGLRFPLRVGRYHSLEADPATLPACLKVTATTDEGDIMAVEHVSDPTFGLQFHPESVLTPEGPQMIANFIELARELRAGA